SCPRGGSHHSAPAGAPWHAKSPPAASGTELPVRVRGPDCDWHVQHLGDRRQHDRLPAVTGDGSNDPRRDPAPWVLSLRRERVRQLNLCRDRPPTAGCSVTTARPSRALAVGFLLTLTLVRLPNADLGSWSELA